MKRLWKAALLPFIVFTLASCQTFTDFFLNSSGVVTGTKTIAQVLAILDEAGYEDLDENNTPSQYTFFEGKINDDYGLDLDVTGFYLGYVPPYTRWVQVVVFGSVANAIAYSDALKADVNVGGYVWCEGNIVIQTSSMETYLLFYQDESSSSETSTISTTSYVVTSSPTSASGETERTAAEMLAILYGAGYVDIESNNDQDTRDYREAQYFTDYGLTVVVTGFYMGYIPEQTRWMMMEEFATAANATAVYDEIIEDSRYYDLYFHLEGRILVQSGSVQTIALFL